MARYSLFVLKVPLSTNQATCHLGSFCQHEKMRFSQKLSNLELWCLLTTYRLFKEPIIGSLKFKIAEIRHLENRHDIFCAKGGLILIKFCRLVQNDMLTAVIWSKSKPDVELQYGRRLSEFHGMSFQSHLPHCRVLPPGEFNIMIPELCVTLQGATTGRIQRHAIPEPRITLQSAATW